MALTQMCCTDVGIYYTTSAAGATSFTSTSLPDATGTQSASSNTIAPAPTAEDSKGGLGVGAIVGIAVGAVAVVIMALLVAFLLWRRRRKHQPSPAVLPPDTSTVQELSANNRRPDVAREVKPSTMTEVVFTPELSAEQAAYATNYEKKSFDPAVSNDAQYPSNQLNPLPPKSAVQVSPSLAKTELAAVMPSEVPGSSGAPPEYGPPYHHGGGGGGGGAAVEADSSTRQSNIISPAISELGYPSYDSHHELSASPYMASYFPPPSRAELSSSSPSSPYHPLGAAMPSSEAYPIATATGSAPLGPYADAGAEDSNLNRMKTEIEAVRAEKERVLHIQALEERERELSREIVSRELLRGASGAGSGAGGAGS
jgi:hypothetical protein